MDVGSGNVGCTDMSCAVSGNGKVGACTCAVPTTGSVLVTVSPTGSFFLPKFGFHRGMRVNGYW